MFEEKESFIDMEDEFAKKKELLKEAEELDKSLSWADVSSKVLELKKKWNKIHNYETAYDVELEDKFNEVIEVFYQKRREGLQSIQKGKEELIHRAKQIQNSNEFNAVTNEMNELLNQWKALGNAGKDIEDKLWNEFNEARTVFFDRKKKFWEERQAKAANAGEVKKGIVEKAKALASSTEWKKTTDEFKELMNEWQAAGFAGKDIDDALWEEFAKARNVFYEAKASAYEAVKAVREENLERKNKLIEEAREVASKEEFTRENTEYMKSLHVKWKEIGQCGKEIDDKVWNEFRQVVDGYFNAMKEASERKHNEWLAKMKDTRNRKQELIQKQQSQLRWMKNELSTLLSEAAVRDMEEDIKDKEAFIAELEEQIKDIDKKIEESK